MLYLSSLVRFVRSRTFRRYVVSEFREGWYLSRTLSTEQMQADIERMRREYAARKDAA